MFPGTTYDSIEGRFRIIRGEAAALKAEIENGTRAPAPARGSNNTTASASSASNTSGTTPKKPRAKKSAANGAPTPKKEKVFSGRVAKSGGANKSAKNSLGFEMMDGSSESGSGNVVNGIKEEVVSSGGSSYLGSEEDAVGEADVPMSTGWEFSDMDGMSAYVMGSGVEGI